MMKPLATGQGFSSFRPVHRKGTSSVGDGSVVAGQRWRVNACGQLRCAPGGSGSGADDGWRRPSRTHPRTPDRTDTGSTEGTRPCHSLSAPCRAWATMPFQPGCFSSAVSARPLRPTWLPSPCRTCSDPVSASELTEPWQRSVVGRHSERTTPAVRVALTEPGPHRTVALDDGMKPQGPLEKAPSPAQPDSRHCTCRQPSSEKPPPRVGVSHVSGDDISSRRAVPSEVGVAPS